MVNLRCEWRRDERLYELVGGGVQWIVGEIKKDLRCICARCVYVRQRIGSSGGGYGVRRKGLKVKSVVGVTGV